MFAFLAAHRGELFADEDFADLFPVGERPATGAEAAHQEWKTMLGTPGRRYQERAGAPLLPSPP